MKSTALVRTACLAFLAAWLMATPRASYGAGQAQPAQTAQEKPKEVPAKQKDDPSDEQIAEDYVIHNEIVVTATGNKKTVFDVPLPSSVIDRDDIAALAPNNMSDILPEVPGTDVVGVGANQSRPIIRGLRGQRILLLTDGIRLSNSRRTQDFGEIPALMDVLGLERVEVVRGPASVLYGSEAIGGVINMISRLPDFGLKDTRLSGQFGYRYSSADSQSKAFGSIGGNVGQLVFMLSGSTERPGTTRHRRGHSARSPWPTPPRSQIPASRTEVSACSSAIVSPGTTTFPSGMSPTAPRTADSGSLTRPPTLPATRSSGSAIRTRK